ncbi:Release factor glutamine methyltransferase [Burkholderiales bacterium]|nr:Release factor glutamine methyltransferase [Burkholderiales bacterium]
MSRNVVPDAAAGEISVRRALAQCGLVPVDAQVLLAHALGVDRAWLVAHATDPLPRERAGAFFDLAKRRRDGEPVAYLVGRREFHGLDLRVTPAVLVPRPETETLVDVALERLPRDRPVDVADLGTGSGAIALAIASARPLARVLATDVSQDALAVARGNAARLGLSNVAFAPGDWYAALAPDAGAFDLVAANPPYVAADDAHLSEGDLRFEPAQALTPGGDGLDALRTIVAGARSHLRAGGWLAVEHGFDQSDAVRALFAEAGFEAVEVRRDLAGIPRVVAGRNLNLGSEP